MPTRRNATTISAALSSSSAASSGSSHRTGERISPRIHSRRRTLTAMRTTTTSAMGGGGGWEARKWAVLVATIWIQAFTGTNFDFSAYSSDLKTVLGVSQVQLNYLAVASDLGKAVGWSSGLAILYLPLPVVLFIAAAMGLAGYGLQWLLITHRLFLPYFSVFFMCLLAGCSICWFNTVCFVLCIRNFSVNRSLALSLTVSFNGVSAALYTLIADSIKPGNESLYLLLNAIVPLIASVAALVPIIRRPPASQPPPPEVARQDSHVFLSLNGLAFLTGLYLLLLTSISPSDDPFKARLLLGGALVLLVLPLFTPGVVCAREWGRQTIYSGFSHLDGGGAGFNLVDVEDLELHKQLLGGGGGGGGGGAVGNNGVVGGDQVGFIAAAGAEKEMGLMRGVMGKDRLMVLGEEHGAWRLLRRIDFWLYYLAYFCGATVGLVYSNNLGQIAQSLGKASGTPILVSTYSACSFFGRLLSSAPDVVRGKLYFARTGWLAIGLVPMPIAFFLLAAGWGGGALLLLAGTGLVGLSSGFIFAAAVSVTSELFGPNNVGLNHNILITNIPLGSLLYGLLAALVYDANGGTSSTKASVVSGDDDGAIVCMGRRCYAATFLGWGCITLVGLASSAMLFLRTKSAYDRFERNRIYDTAELITRDGIHIMPDR